MWIDFFFFEMVEYMNYLSGSNIYAKYPTLEAYHNEFLALPTIAKVWSDDVKIMKYPFNNASALIGGRDSKILNKY